MGGPSTFTFTQQQYETSPILLMNRFLVPMKMQPTVSVSGLFLIYDQKIYEENPYWLLSSGFALMLMQFLSLSLTCLLMFYSKRASSNLNRLLSVISYSNA